MAFVEWKLPGVLLSFGGSPHKLDRAANRLSFYGEPTNARYAPSEGTPPAATCTPPRRRSLHVERQNRARWPPYALARCACLDLLRWGVAVSPDPASTSPPGGSSSTRAVSFLRPCRSSRAPRLHGATVPREGGRSSAAPKGHRRPSAVSWPRAPSMEVYLELPPDGPHSTGICR